jgi:hypothetical protein
MVAANIANIANNNEKDHYSAKPPIFDGEKFDYWKDRIDSFFLGYDVDLWDLVVDGYGHLVNVEGNILARSAMFDQQKKDFKNHHKAKTILLNVISYTEYEKITNRDSAKSIFESLRMTHEGNAQVKETKAFALIQKYEAFKMEDDENIKPCSEGFRCLLQNLRFWTKGILQLIMSRKLSEVFPKYGDLW